MDPGQLVKVSELSTLAVFLICFCNGFENANDLFFVSVIGFDNDVADWIEASGWSVSDEGSVIVGALPWSKGGRLDGSVEIENELKIEFVDEACCCGSPVVKGQETYS